MKEGKLCPICKEPMMEVVKGDKSNSPVPHVRDVYAWTELGCFECNTMHLTVYMIPQYSVEKITVHWEMPPTVKGEFLE